MNDRPLQSPFVRLRSKRPFATDFCVNYLSILVALCCIAPQLTHAQQLATISTSAKSAGTSFERPVTVAPSVDSELTVVGLVSYGNYQIFASGKDCKLYASGVEYDRHSWGHLLKSRVDYVGEVLPFLLLDEPAKADVWGNPLTLKRQLLHGVGISPIGVRFLWRDGRAWKPYLMAKGGVVAFDKKAISSQGSYVNFSLQSSMGVQIRMTDRVDLRLGLFGDFHFSNAYMVPVNPGLDVMNANWGLTYHLGRHRPVVASTANY